MASLMIGLAFVAALSMTGTGPDGEGNPHRLATNCALELPEASPTTTSIGHPYSGRLRDGVRLPHSGPFHDVQRSTRRRNWVYGTGYLVRGILRAGEAIMQTHPDGPPLVLGNLSRRGGGDIRFSRSHNTGRDVDIAYYMEDLDGRPVPSEYHRFGPDGRSIDAPDQYKLDIPRNWAAVKAFAQSPEFEVQWIIVAPYIENMLLEYARTQGEPEAFIDQMERMMMLPSWAKVHDNHIHLRVLCSPTDWSRGCRNGGPVWPWNHHMRNALVEATQETVPKLESDVVSERLRALRTLSNRRVYTSVLDISPLLNDPNPAVQRRTQDTVLDLLTEANAATVLAIAQEAPPRVAARLLAAALPLAGKDAVETARSLVEGTHPLNLGELRRTHRRTLLSTAEAVLRAQVPPPGASAQPSP